MKGPRFAVASWTQERGRRGWFLLLALLANSCHASATTQASPTSTPVVTAPPSPKPLADASASTRETRLVERMLARVERARGLEAKRAVPGVRLPRASLIARVKEHVARELPPRAIRNEGLALQLFGFLPTEFDYEAAEYRLLEEQLAGYYEPADGTMYMATDLGDDEATATLAHELVHALQDQHWDLESRSKYRPGEGDHSEAVSALAEGDATSAMFDVMIAGAAPGVGKTALDLPDSEFVAQIREGMSQGPGASAPHVMRSSLAAPYIYGTLFVNALRRRGGWAAVDAAWEDAPTTTEQVLHVEKWLAHEPPMHVNPAPFGALGPGWSVADEDSEGELGARIAFEEWFEPTAAAELAAGWGGDRGVLVLNGDKAAFAWTLRYDALDLPKPKDDRALRAYAALRRALDKSFGPPQVKDANFECRERKDRGPLSLARVGGALTFTLGPAQTSPGGWSSAGTCAASRAWQTEIARSLQTAER